MIGFVGGLGAWASHSLIDFWLQKHLSPHDHHYPAYVHASLSLPDFALNAHFNETLLASLRKAVVQMPKEVTSIYILCNTAHLFFEEWSDERCCNWFLEDVSLHPKTNLIGSEALAQVKPHHYSQMQINYFISSVIEGKHFTHAEQLRKEWQGFVSRLTPFDRLACTELSLLNHLFSEGRIPDTSHRLFYLLEQS
jgi:aspartate/glutamate racemase